MTARAYTQRQPANGYAPNDGAMVKISCSFDPETFAAISALARQDKRSFREQVRLLVEWGLESTS